MEQPSILPATTDHPSNSAPRTLEDLKVFIESHPNLEKRQRRDLASAVKSLASYLNQPTDTLPADGRSLRHSIERLRPEPLGVSQKRLDNVISGVRTALNLASGAFPGLRRKAHLTPEWLALRGRLPEKSRYIYHLSRFVRFCSDRGITPATVEDSTFAAFHDHLEKTSLRSNTRQPYRSACIWWNHAVTDIDGWPSRTVTVPSFKAQPKSIPFSAFPQSFQEDVEACRAQLSSSTPFAHKTTRRGPNGKRRRVRREPYSKATVDTHVRNLKAAASGLVRAGYCAAEEVTDIAVLCKPDAAEELLRFYFDEAGERPTAYTRSLAVTLKTVAESYLVADPEQVDDLALNITAMAPESEGLTPKNEQRLQAFNSREDKEALLDVPRRLVETARANGYAHKRDAINLMIAAALEILFVAPLRLKNLTSLELDRHLRWPGKVGNPAYLHLPKAEVKNSQDLDFTLPSETIEVIRLYREHARGWWLDVDDPRLFPFGQTQNERRYFGTLVSQRVKCVSGFDVNVHLFRHIAAKFYLEANPGDYGTVRLVLGHRRLETTIRYYCGTERSAALKKHDETLRDLRPSEDDPGALKKRRRNQRRRRQQQLEDPDARDS